MTEWEQMKTEYHDVQIPANGSHQIQETITKATYDRNKNRRKKLIRYSATVAAMFLVVLLVPVIWLFWGSGSTENADYNTSAGAPATNDTSMRIPVISQNKTAQTEDSTESVIVEDTWNDSGNEMKQEAGIPESNG